MTGERDRGTETETIRRKALRMDEARKRRRESAWYGLGMFGLVGWSGRGGADRGGDRAGSLIDQRRPGGSRHGR